ncbi:MAG: N-acetyltransferase [Deferrisomatales bacterium]|nr:N-acetyltransferase [Deferrisomatales bacterium]
MGAVVTRPFAPADVPDLLGVTQASGVFRAEEGDVAREVLEACAARGHASGYFCRVAAAESGTGLEGFACWGPAPCTEGTFDLYWLVVHPRAQGRGIASRLLAEAESDAARRGGRQLVAETSSTEPYAPARSFYEERGFRLTARIPDFYRLGDAKVVYVKPLSPRRGGKQERWNSGRRS